MSAHRRASVGRTQSSLVSSPGHPLRSQKQTGSEWSPFRFIVWQFRARVGRSTGLWSRDDHVLQIPQSQNSSPRLAEAERERKCQVQERLKACPAQSTGCSRSHAAPAARVAARHSDGTGSLRPWVLPARRWPRLPPRSRAGQGSKTGGASGKRRGTASGGASSFRWFARLPYWYDDRRLTDPQESRRRQTHKKCRIFGHFRASAALVHGKQPRVARRPYVPPCLHSRTLSAISPACRKHPAGG